MSKVTVESSGTNYRFEINARTHAATVDATAALKGGDTAMTPHEAFWGGLAACTGMTIAMFSLIVFSIVVMSTLNANFTAAFASDDARGGWDVVATSNRTNPVPDLTGTLRVCAAARHGLIARHDVAAGYDRIARFRDPGRSRGAAGDEDGRLSCGRARPGHFADRGGDCPARPRSRPAPRSHVEEIVVALTKTPDGATAS